MNKMKLTMMVVKQYRSWVIALLLIWTMALFAPVYAGSFGVINTGDGIVDPLWVSVGPFVTDAANDSTNPGNGEIVNGYFITDAPTPTLFSFRVEGVNVFGFGLVAELDCNNNGSFTEAVDRVINAATLTITDGTGTPVGMANAEVIGSTNGEMTAPASAMGVCASSVISLRVRTPFDQTTPRAYNVPTAVSLQSLTAQERSPGASLFLTALLATLMVSGLFIWRRRAAA